MTKTKILNLKKLFISTKEYVKNSFDNSTKTLLTLFDEPWYEISDMINEDFFNELFTCIEQDHHITDDYFISNNERFALIMELNRRISNTTSSFKKNKLIEQLKTIQNINAPKFKVSATTVINAINKMLLYNLNTLVILKHPEQYAGFTIETSCITSQNNSLLHSVLSKCINYYEDEHTADHLCFLETEKFSFKLLNENGISFGYETPIFTSKLNMEQHNFYWQDFMLGCYKKIITAYSDINIVTVGCSDDFINELNSMLGVYGSSVIELPSIYKYDEFRLNQDAVAVLGEVLGTVLYQIDERLKNEGRRDKLIMKYE